MGSILIYDDVTREVEKQEYLELLIRESNHKVRNNLNLLNRFISLEKRFHGGDPDKIIENTVSRIDSFALFHEKLYKTENLKYITVNEYLTSFIEDISALYGEGCINIKYGSNDDEIILHYSDDGKGMPEGFNPTKNTGLGWIIIQSLSNQLDGEYDVFNDDGMNFKLSFHI